MATTSIAILPRLGSHFSCRTHKHTCDDSQASVGLVLRDYIVWLGLSLCVGEWQIYGLLSLGGREVWIGKEKIR